MIIKEAKYFPFEIKLKTPFINSSQTITHREGFIIKLTDELGNIGYGECSPLTGFSKESLSEAEVSLNAILDFTKSRVFENDFSISAEFISVKFSLEQALLNLVFQRNDEFWKSKFNFSQKSVPVNAVVGFDSLANSLALIKNKIAEGISTFKIKVGRENPYDDFTLIEEIRNNFGADIKLRLDANQKWSADEAIEYLYRFESYGIEFVEEPCAYLSSNLHANEETNIPIALDESLHQLSFDELVSSNYGIDFLIIKPMVFGGILETLKIIEAAKTSGKKIIISSSFESCVGKEALVLLARAVDHDFAHGLDTTDYFENDLCADLFPVQNGRINFNQNSFTPKFDLTF